MVWHLLVLFAFCLPALARAQTLDIYFIDVEGGEATLIVTPDHQSMLVDTGWDGFGNRDAERIGNAARAAGVMRLDYLLITHFHRDHVGGAPEIVKRLPVATFVDYGEPVERDEFAQAPFAAYAAVRGDSSHIRAAPGDTIGLKGVDVAVVSGGGAVISQPLAGVSSEPNSACVPVDADRGPVSENPRSLGIRLRFGQFTFLDLGDLSGATLHKLVCPHNLIGRADVYVMPHHGNADGAVPGALNAVSPTVVILNNGASKGGSAAGFAALHGQPAIENVWQLHRSRNEGVRNFADAFIANLDEGEKDRGAWLKVSANQNGSFTVTNGRTGTVKSYK